MRRAIVLAPLLLSACAVPFRTTAEQRKASCDQLAAQAADCYARAQM